jgi:hypothetical protein
MRRLDILPGLDWLRRRPIALAAFAALASPVHASDYYAGKTITFLVGTDTGGGFSLYARAIAKHLARHIPGNPMIVIRNMPGAGGAVASTWLYHIAPKDGTAIGSVAPNAILGRLLGEGRGGYEPEKFNYLAGAERSTRVCVTFHHSRVRTLQDALSHRAVIGATTVGSPTREYASIVKHTIGARFEIVSGYKGPADLFVAMERGEIDGICGIDWSALAAGGEAQSAGAGRAPTTSRACIARCADAMGVHQRRHRPQSRRADGRVSAGVRADLYGAARHPGRGAAHSALRFHGRAARSGLSGRRQESTD